MKLIRAFVIAIVLLFSNISFGQQFDALTDTILEKLNWYGIKNEHPTLFVHFDKNIYTENENVWFTAYLLKTDTSIDEYNTLSVALVRNHDRSILAAERFVMGQGLSFGNIFLPDSLPPGDYNFIAYTNRLRNNQPEDVFVQPVTIKSGKEPLFIATLKMAEPLTANADSVRLVVRAYTPAIKLLKSIPVSFVVGDTIQPVKKGVVNTDAFGEAKFSIPLKQLNSTNNLLQTTVKYGNDEKIFRLTLPVFKSAPSVKFYPEGGNLVEGLSNVIGWEARNTAGEPMIVAAALLRNNQPIDTIRTNTKGLGRFYLSPEPATKYAVKLLYVDGVDTMYQLPTAIQNAPAINVLKAVSDDTLYVNLLDNQAQHYLLLIHNYQHAYITTTISSIGKPLLVKIPLQELPKGLATLTLLNAAGKPVAERLFFAHANKQVAVEITSNKKQYATREKVNLNVKINSKNYPGSLGFFSIACVQDNRIDVRKMNDIVSYAYLKSELEGVGSIKNIFFKESDLANDLENVLLIKGWRRYRWEDAMTTKSGDTIIKKTSVVHQGVTTYSGKTVKAPVEMGLFNNKSFDVINTDSAGNFILNADQLFVNNQNKLSLFINKKNKDNYSIRMPEPYSQLNTNLAKTLSFQSFDPQLSEQNTQAVLIKQDERAKQLLDVKVTAKKDNSFFSGEKNECGDYVCPYNILNCPNHPFGYTVPIKGRYYTQNGIRVQYKGCGNTDSEERFLITFPGINVPKEFYVPDYAKYNPTEPEYHSTIFWKHSVVTNANGEANLSFYTSDIAGRYRVVVQGVTTEDCFYGEQIFEVTK